MDDLEAGRPSGRFTVFHPGNGLFFSDSEWQSERASQVLTHFPRDELALMSRYYGQLPDFRGFEEQEGAPWRELSILRAPPAAMTASDLMRLKVNLEAAKYFERLIVVNARRQLGLSQRLGVIDSGLDPVRVRVRTAAVGGAFGGKIPTYPEHVVIAWLAQQLMVAVRWSETRIENMVAMTHGRGQVQYVELGATRDGRLAGLRVYVIQDIGAYASEAATLPPLTGLMASGPYRIPRIDFHAVSVLTNTTPVGAYRGAGRPEATWLLERAMDMLAGDGE